MLITLPLTMSPTLGRLVLGLSRSLSANIDAKSSSSVAMGAHSSARSAYNHVVRAALVVLIAGCGRLHFGEPDGGPDASRQTYREAVLADGPIGYWRLADTGLTARDEMGVTD